jgi:RNA polymerase sigma-70 factor (ECF subfamily)
VDAAISGDLQAFVALYDRYSERVYRYVYYYVGNQADAEDVTQEVFLRAWKGIGRYRRTGAKFVSWLLTIAHNTRLDAFRPGRETRELDDIDCPAPTRWSDPEAEALAESDRLAVRRGILRLKPDQQRVITMHFLEHLEYAEIAAALGKSEGNVRVIQLRALVSLRRLLADEVAA